MAGYIGGQNGGFGGFNPSSQSMGMAPQAQGMAPQNMGMAPAPLSSQGTSWGGLPTASAPWTTPAMQYGLTPWQTQRMPAYQQQQPVTPTQPVTSPYLPAGTSASTGMDFSQPGGQPAAPAPTAPQQMGPQAMGIVPWQGIINRGEDMARGGGQGDFWTPSAGFGVQGQNLVYDVAQPGNFGMRPNIGNQYYMPYDQENF